MTLSLSCALTCELDEHIELPLARLSADRQLRQCVYADPSLRPPIIDEMMPDINRVIASLGRNYNDATCVSLHADELEAECRIKLARALENPRFLIIPTRAQAFKWLKTVFSNHVRGLVARHRFTIKRGGQRQETDDGTQIKNVELRLDDEEARITPADSRANWSSSESLIEDLKPYLSPLELLIVQELNVYSPRTMAYAELDSYRKWKPGSEKPSIKITYAHMAAGIGISLQLFETTLTTVQVKIRQIQMSEATTEEISWNRAVTLLEEKMEVHAPPSLDKTIIRRLFTVAALDQYDMVKANPEVRKALAAIGAKVPEDRGGHIACFGVLFQNNHKTCASCQLKTPCASEAANFGLDKITISDRLLGARALRIPAVLANDEVYMTPEEEAIYHYMAGFLQAVQAGPEVHFKSLDNGQLLFVLEQTPTIRFKFVKPVPEMRAKLTKEGPSFYLPATAAPAAAHQLINDHCTSLLVS